MSVPQVPLIETEGVGMEESSIFVLERRLRMMLFLWEKEQGVFVWMFVKYFTRDGPAWDGHEERNPVGVGTPWCAANPG